MNRNTSAARSVIGMLIVLGTAWGLDALLTYLGRGAVTFTLPHVILWTHSLGFMLLAALLLILFWYVLMRAPRNRRVAALYLVTGLFWAFYPMLYLWPRIGHWMPGAFLASLSGPTTYTITTGAFIAITGLLSLILPRR